MPIQMNEGDSGNVLAIHVNGKLAKADYANFVPKFERLIRKYGKVGVLFDMTGLSGREAGALWKDTKFVINYFADIKRIAMVGETKWQRGMAMFCKPFMKAEVRYFDHADDAEAQQWLAKAQPLRARAAGMSSPRPAVNKKID